MTRLFGTDGVRGRAGTELTADLAFRLGRAAAGFFMERGLRRCLLARDTRISGGMLSAAFMSGAASVGVDSTDIGIAPTPAVSVLLGSNAVPAAFGVVISASHNPYPDNGIKLFSSDGAKLTVAEEEAIERRVTIGTELDAADKSVGKILRNPNLMNLYIQSLRSRFSPSPQRGEGRGEGFALKKICLVIDAAHGAWAPHVKQLFTGTCETILFLNCDYTGYDINESCGSTHLDNMDSALSTQHSGLTGIGLAFDGDGDRCLVRLGRSVLSPQSSVLSTVDGDAMLFLFAKHLVTSGPVVGTVMSNGALAAALEQMGRPFLRAPVGDREVYELMCANKSGLGGEQSGHIIFRSLLSPQSSSLITFDQRTGDGAVTALAFLKVFSEHYGESVDALRRDLPAPFPQKLVNLRVAEKRPWEEDKELARSVSEAQEKLGPHGRLIIRYSGTEPLLRLMAESPSAAAVDEQLAFLADRFRERLS